MVALQWFHVLEGSLKVMDQVRTAKVSSPMEKVPGRLEKAKAKVRAKAGVRGTVGMGQLVGRGKKWEQACRNSLDGLVVCVG